MHPKSILGKPRRTAITFFLGRARSRIPEAWHIEVNSFSLLEHTLSNLKLNDVHPKNLLNAPFGNPRNLNSFLKLSIESDLILSPSFRYFLMVVLEISIDLK